MAFSITALAHASAFLGYGIFGFDHDFADRINCFALFNELPELAFISYVPGFALYQSIETP